MGWHKKLNFPSDIKVLVWPLAVEEKVIDGAVALVSRHSLCVRPPLWWLGVKKAKMFLPGLFVKMHYGGEPLRPRGSVCGLRQPRLEFRGMSLEGSVIRFISQSSEVEASPGPA